MKCQQRSAFGQSAKLVSLWKGVSVKVERDRKTEGEGRQVDIYIYTHTYIYIYIYTRTWIYYSTSEGFTRERDITSGHGAGGVDGGRVGEVAVQRHVAGVKEGIAHVHEALS